MMDQAVLVLVRSALEQEPYGTVPDSVYHPAATFVANGREQAQAPRFAGMGLGGRVRVLGVSGDIIPPYAWAVADYQWLGPAATAAESGKATFLLQLTEGRWRVRHVHSSMVLPWDPGAGQGGRPE